MEYKYWLLSAVRRWRRKRKRTKMVTVIKNNLLLIGR
jgi:hypothetical protein